MNRFRGRRVPQDAFVDRPRINEQIRVPFVRVVGADRKPIGIMQTREALALARNQELDLVLVAPTGDPPVCAIMDFGKYLYEQKIRAKESKRKQHASQVRDIRMKMKIDTHDYNVKLKKMREILDVKDRIRVTLIIRGREVLHIDLAYKLLDRLKADLQDIARTEGEPRVQLEGRKSIQLMLVPR